jgi:hypothetical protein
MKLSEAISEARAKYFADMSKAKDGEAVFVPKPLWREMAAYLKPRYRRYRSPELIYSKGKPIDMWSDAFVGVTRDLPISLRCEAPFPSTFVWVCVYGKPIKHSPVYCYLRSKLQ